MRRRTLTSALILAALPLGWGQAGIAQVDLGSRPIDDLPRPGYEPKRIRVGNTILSPEVEAGATYDSNVFATSSNADDDVLFTLTPSMGIRHESDGVKVDAAAFATLREYAENHDEAVNTFGAAADTRYSIGNGHVLSTVIGAGRSFERRSDPESSNSTGTPPAKIDSLRSEMGYQYRPGRIGFGIRGAAEKYNYLPDADDDRDQTSLRGSARVTAEISHRFDTFAEAYINRRDARTAVDRSGVDRDMTTKGLLVGVASTISERLTGELGMGIFHANSDDPTIKSFDGFAASGNLTWRPRIRTAITASLSSGDVATIRAGASGRIDTTASLRLDQEARHNLILSGTLAVRATSYRGGINNDQTLWSALFEATYLVNRHASIVATTSFTKRTADQPLDKFESFRCGLATRFYF